MTRAWPWLVGTGSALALLGAGHCAYNLRRLARPEPVDGPEPGRIAVLIPARNEAERIGATITSVLAQSNVPGLSVTVLDDDSSDGTGGAVAAASAADPRVSLLRSTSPPPPGWLGKPYACARLADAAPEDASALVFLDADVVLDPHAISAAVHRLRSGKADFASLWPRQIASGALPRLVQPLQQWSWATTLPLGAAARSPRPSLTAANGQFLIMTPGTYRAAGGHAAVANCVLEDIELARAAKHVGCRVEVWDGSALASCQMYRSPSEVRAGYAKSLWAAVGPRDAPLGVRAAGSALVFGLLGWAYLAPPIAVLAGPTKKVRLIGLAGYAGAAANRALVARRTGSPIWPDSLAHPVSVMALGAMLLDSFLARAAGRTVWKGRTLP